MKKYISIISLIVILAIFSGLAFAEEDNSAGCNLTCEDVADEELAVVEDDCLGETPGNFNQLNAEIETKNEIDVEELIKVVRGQNGEILEVDFDLDACSEKLQNVM